MSSQFIKTMPAMLATVIITVAIAFAAGAFITQSAYADNISIKVSVVDADSATELSGAKLKLNKDGIDASTVLEWMSSGDKPYEIENVTPGDYILRETSAPPSYEKVKADIKFNVSEDGKITLIGQYSNKDIEVAVDGTLILKNKVRQEDPKKDVYISKAESSNGPEIEGATLVVTKDTKDGEAIASWISGKVAGETGPHKLSILPGRYVLSETLVPDDFHLQAESITFSVDEDGTITLDSGTADNNTIVMIDNPAGALKFTVEEEETGDGVKGAIITITTMKTDGTTETKEYTTDSDGMIYIPNLPVGNDYSYKYTTIPEKYVVSSMGEETGVVVNSKIVTEKTIKIKKNYVSTPTEKQKPTARELTANGKEQELITAAESLPEGCKAVEYSTDDGKNWSEEIPVGKKAGQYVIRVRYVADENHFTIEGEPLTVTISPAEMQVTSSGYEGTYDGTGHSITVNAPDGAAVKYSTDGGRTWSGENPAFVDAGTNTVDFKASHPDYKDYKASEKVIINKADITPSVSIEGWEYGSKANKPSVEGNPGGGEVTFQYKKTGEPDSAYTETVPTDAGEYTVKAKIAETANYKAGEATVDFTISPADMEVTAGDYQGTYDGAEHGITVNAPEGATVEYSSDGGETWTGEKPVFTEAGTHNTDFRVSLANYKEYTGSRQVIILQAAITIKADDKSSKYGEALKKLTCKVSGAYVKGDDLGVKLSTAAKKTAPGTTAIKVSWNNNPNYEAKLVNGKYTVGRKPQPKINKAAARIALDGGVVARSSGKKVTASWGAVKGASSYVIYANYCDQKNCKKLKTVSGKTTSFDITKVNGKKFNPKKNLKFYVVAYKTVKGKKVKLATSITAHAPGSKNSKRTNVTGVKVKKASFTLKKGKTAKIKAKLSLQKKNRKPLKHEAKFRYATSNAKVAKVNKKGKITAVGKGKCNVYVYAVSGVSKKIKVTVK